MKYLVTVFLVIFFGCSSVQKPPPCTEVPMPDVVTEIVSGPPLPLPLPEEPVVPDVDLDDPLSTAGAVYLILDSLKSAYDECVGIIKGHNAQSDPPDP